MTTRHPDLFLLYAIPNGGARSKRTAGRMKAQGVMASVPDLCLPVACGPFHALYVELKRPGSYGTPAQRDMAARLTRAGNAVFECQGVEEAMQVILGYLALGSFQEREKVWSERVTLTAMLTPRRR